jgi:hypothetical protein
LKVRHYSKEISSGQHMANQTANGISSNWDLLEAFVDNWFYYAGCSRPCSWQRILDHEQD